MSSLQKLIDFVERVGASESDAVTQVPPAAATSSESARGSGQVASLLSVLALEPAQAAAQFDPQALLDLCDGCSQHLASPHPCVRSHA
jgi:hypothetical protein